MNTCEFKHQLHSVSKNVKPLIVNNFNELEPILIIFRTGICWDYWLL